MCNVHIQHLPVLDIINVNNVNFCQVVDLLWSIVTRLMLLLGGWAVFLFKAAPMLTVDIQSEFHYLDEADDS